MNADEIKVVLDAHKLWLDDKPEGECANLEGANLVYANLVYANLVYANLEGATMVEGWELRKRAGK